MARRAGEGALGYDSAHRFYPVCTRYPVGANIVRPQRDRSLRKERPQRDRSLRKERPQHDRSLCKERPSIRLTIVRAHSVCPYGIHSTLL